MKNLALLILILFNYSCNAQINEKFKGCWLPEKYVLAIMANDTSIADKFLFPVEGFEILKERTVEFLKYSELENEVKDINKILLMKAYRSEINSVLMEKTVNENKEKYHLPYFYSYLNMKYIPKETIEKYKKANIYLSKVGDKLVLEVVEKGKQEKIYFIKETNSYVFKTIEESKKYLYTNNVKDYTGKGNITKEISLTGKETTIKLSYEFYKEPDQLVIEDQGGKELFKTETYATNGMKSTTVQLQGVTKLVFKIKSEQPNSQWHFKVEFR